MKRFYIVGYPHYFKTLAEACTYVEETFFEMGVAEKKEIASVRSGRCYSIEHDGKGNVDLCRIVTH